VFIKDIRFGLHIDWKTCIRIIWNEHNAGDFILVTKSLSWNGFLLPPSFIRGGG